MQFRGALRKEVVDCREMYMDEGNRNFEDNRKQ
jgi:hypothetical protein